MIDHDRLFKELLTTFFVEFLELFFPQVSAYIDHNSLEFLDKEIFTDVTSGEKYEADILVKARFREQEGVIILHVENQADAQADFNRRMFRYFSRLHDKHALPIYPIALLTFEEPFRAEPDEYIIAFPDFTPLEFRFRTIQLNRLNWRDFVRQANPVASALMSTMKIAPEERPKVKVECLRLLATLKLNPAKMKMISGFVDTYLSLTPQEEKVFQEEIEAISPKRTKEKTMEIVTSWMRTGIEQGRVQGHETALRMVLRQIGRKFGNIEAEAQTRIAALTLAQLEALEEALQSFTDKAELGKWLEREGRDAPLLSA